MKKIKEMLLLLFLCTQTSYGSPIETMIYGGEEAALGEFSWMVSIQTPKDLSGAYVHICSGTLVSPTKIVTAAHCVTTLSGYPSGRTRVVAGAHNITTNEGSQQIRAIDTDGIYIHYLYNKEGPVVYDVAIIQLSNDNQFFVTDRVRWATLPSHNAPSSGICQIAGWGATRDKFSSDVLLRADIPIVSKYDCRIIYPETFHHPSQICAGILPEGGVDTCIGDTGGAIICHNIGYRFFAGIAVGGGAFCGAAGKPGIYAEISHIISWINNPQEGMGEIEPVLELFKGEVN